MKPLQSMLRVVVAGIAMVAGAMAHASPLGTASGYAVLHSFGSGTDGAGPLAAVTVAADGSLYGTTPNGGASCDCGTVFKIAADGTESVLHAFTGEAADGAFPKASLTPGPNGVFYGTTEKGGAYGFGTVYRLNTDGSAVTLHSFRGGIDGANPQSALTWGGDGQLYGTTPAGGAANVGTVYRISPKGEKQPLYSFKGGADGAAPIASLMLASNGLFYGTTSTGGTDSSDCPSGCGTVFSVTSNGEKTTLYAFSWGVDGARPSTRLVEGRDGNFYGTTAVGGDIQSPDCNVNLIDLFGCGAVFRITPAGAESVLLTFTWYNGAGANGLIAGKDGYLYGTTATDGLRGQVGEPPPIGGLVYRLTLSGEQTFLYEFPEGGSGSTDGDMPLSGLAQGADGTLYGTTADGGDYGYGTVFRIRPWF